MRTNLVLLAIFVALTTNGSSCINSGFLVPVNVPIDGCYGINPGSNLNFSGRDTVVLKDQIDESFLEKIEGGRVYDVQVSVEGTYRGTVVGTASVDNILLLNFGQGPNATTPTDWSNFSTPQSLLGSSPYVKPTQAGINHLISIMNQFAGNPELTVNLSASGSLAGVSPVPAGLSVCVKILTQADAKLND
jgi:hypothetical protein